MIAVRARDDEAIEAAVAAVERELAAKGAPGRAPSSAPAARSLAAAARRDDELSLAFLSIPGEHVALRGVRPRWRPACTCSASPTA